jgi:hypothetical protein
LKGTLVADYDRIVRAGAYIQGARMAFTSEPPDKEEAMSRLSAAYAEARFAITGELEFIKLPSGVQLDSQMKASIRSVNEVLTFIALSVDMLEYQYIPKLFPHTSITTSGDYHSTHWNTYDDLDQETFNLGVNFVESLVKKAQELERRAAPLKKLRVRP